MHLRIDTIFKLSIFDSQSLSLQVITTNMPRTKRQSAAKKARKKKASRAEVSRAESDTFTPVNTTHVNRKGRTYSYKSTRMRTRYPDPQFRALWKYRMRGGMRGKYLDPQFRAQKLCASKIAYANRRIKQRSQFESHFTNAIAHFHQIIQEGPTYTCVSCHRHMYKQSVKKFILGKYNSSIPGVIDSVLEAFPLQPKQDPMFICNTCHSCLVRGKIPAQAAINGLMLLDDVPTELILTELESTLIAQRIPFICLLALPRGRQMGIHGAIVNVPNDVQSCVTSLPRTPAEAGIIPLKLKRRLGYKGYVCHQFVRSAAVICGLIWLIFHNPLYSHIAVKHTERVL
jgi:hypothetical protein